MLFWYPLSMDLLSRIETFVTAAEQRNFTRAADELGIPQPLLSRRIKSLEQAWDNELFDRSRRQIELTRFAELVLPYAQDLLQRARHLDAVARSVTASIVHAVGVPPDCPPPALARMIRTAVDRGVAITVHEAPAHARAAAFEAGSLDLAVLRTTAERGALTVPLGIASCTPSPEASRPIRLDALRPRRGAPRDRAPGLMIVPEDDLDPFADALARAIARAGLPAGRVQAASSTSSAAAEVLAGRAWLLCDATLARHHRLAWCPLADRSLDRQYEIAVAGHSTLSDDTLAWLTPLLHAAIAAGPPTVDHPLAPRVQLTASA